jgi:NADH:ubiquinone oxidoreductase subunit E
MSTPLDDNGKVVRFTHGSRVPGWDEAVDLTKDPAPVPDPATTPVPADLRVRIEGYMARYPDRHSAVIPSLADAQNVHGWCSPEAIDQVACVMRITPGYVDAIATFYDMFATEPVGAHDIYVCTNISCSVRGADALFDAFTQATEGDPGMHVQPFECLGACDLAPMVSVDGVYVGPLELDDVPAVLDDVRAGRPVLPAKQLATMPIADAEANTQAWPAPKPLPTVPGGADPVPLPDP